MTQAGAPPHSPHRVAIVLTIVVGVIATAVAYRGTRENPQVPVAPATAPAGTTLAMETIVLPHAEPELPPGPHQRTFAAACTVCHSTRLVMTQPAFPRKQWTEVVHKMVKTYGAAISPEAEEQIVDYLVTIRGKS